MEQYMHKINTEDFNTMREILSEIELKIVGVDPERQEQFYRLIKHIIFEAWQDACNPNDTFLFSTHTSKNK